MTEHEHEYPVAHERTRGERVRGALLGLGAAVALVFALVAVLAPGGNAVPQGVDAEGIAHGQPGHNHAQMQAAQAAAAQQAEDLYTEAKPDPQPVAKERKIKDPAPAPKAKDKVSVSGCLRGYGEVGQCVPASWPGTDGVLHAVSCETLADVFPKGFTAPKNDFAHLDPNGDRTACGEGD